MGKHRAPEFWFDDDGDGGYRLRRRGQARWVRAGSHDAARWFARVPSATRASQAGLLHGTNEGIPAFRRYDKSSGRLFVANRPADAAAIEARLSDGRGLLAAGGVSMSNTFTGDAPTTLM